MQQHILLTTYCKEKIRTVFPTVPFFMSFVGSSVLDFPSIYFGKSPIGGEADRDHPGVLKRFFSLSIEYFFKTSVIEGLSETETISEVGENAIKKIRDVIECDLTLGDAFSDEVLPDAFKGVFWYVEEETVIPYKELTGDAFVQYRFEYIEKNGCSC